MAKTNKSSKAKKNTQKRPATDQRSVTRRVILGKGTKKEIKSRRID